MPSGIPKDWPLAELRRRCQVFNKQQRRLAVNFYPYWKFHNIFLRRRVERHEVTREFRIIGGQVHVRTD